MATLPIVEHFNVIKNSHLRFLTSMVNFFLNQPCLKDVEETFRHSILLAVPYMGASGSRFKMDERSQYNLSLSHAQK